MPRKGTLSIFLSEVNLIDHFLLWFLEAQESNPRAFLFLNFFFLFFLSFMEWWKVIRIITVPSDKRHHCGQNRILFSPSQSFLVGRAEELSELGRRERNCSETRWEGDATSVRVGPQQRNARHGVRGQKWKRSFGRYTCK